MVLLTLDRALSIATAAIWQDDQCLWTYSWQNAIRQSHWVSQLTNQSPIDLSTIDACCVGTGPGSFSGIRGAIAFAQGLTLPKSKSLLGVSTIAALSHRLNTTIVGDARRGMLWLYDGSFRLIPQAEFKPDSPLTSPDAERLQRIYPQATILPAISEPQDLGRYLLAHPEASTHDPEPTYLQPAV